MKKLTAAALAATMGVSLLISTGATAENAGAQEDEYPVVRMAYTHIFPAEDEKAVEDAMNEILREEAHAEVDLISVDFSDLTSQMNLLLTGGKEPLDIWKEALDKITPQVEVKSRRIGGATFQVPTEIRPDRKTSISMKNLINFARKRAGKSMAEKLAAEILDAYHEQGGAYKRKEDLHRMAEANRAFAHFRF